MANSNVEDRNPPKEPSSFSAEEIAGMVGGRAEGETAVRLRGIAPLDQARKDELGFLAQRRYLKYLGRCQAGAILVSEALAGEAVSHPTRIVVADAHQALPILLGAFFPEQPGTPGIHPTAIFGEGVQLGDGVSVGPYAVLGDGARIGSGARIGPHVVVGEGCVIGEDSRLFPQVVLYPGTQVGERVILHSGVRLGSDGYGYVTVEGVHRKVPQVGACVVEDDVEIGANTCIDRGSIGRTVVGKGSKLDNLVQLGHNVQVGDGSLIVAQAGVAGSTRLGRYVVLGGQAGVSGHLDLGDGAMVGAQGGVTGNIDAGEVVSGYPARRHREYLRGMSLLFNLPKTLKRIRELEARLEKLEGTPEG
jgi:UDP-3-O-[3-hydroxymyristoyl] glucosamine N-acyltransferase